MSEINHKSLFTASPLLSDEKSANSHKSLSHATHSFCILQHGLFLQAMKRIINWLEQIICFQHRCFIQVTDESLEVPPSRAYLAIPRRTRSAWAELRRKAVLFYLGTVGTQGEKSQLFHLQLAKVTQAR